jgi:hypothetical protein
MLSFRPFRPAIGFSQTSLLQLRQRLLFGRLLRLVQWLDSCDWLLQDERPKDNDVIIVSAKIQQPAASQVVARSASETSLNVAAFTATVRACRCLLVTSIIAPSLRSAVGLTRTLFLLFAACRSRRPNAVRSRAATSARPPRTRSSESSSSAIADPVRSSTVALELDTHVLSVLRAAACCSARRNPNAAAEAASAAAARSTAQTAW